jgi:hypothetical protein
LVSTKNLEIESSFLEFLFHFFKISNLTTDFSKTDETDPHEFILFLGKSAGFQTVFQWDSKLLHHELAQREHKRLRNSGIERRIHRVALQI